MTFTAASSDGLGLVLSLDLGTSHVKAALIDRHGSVHATATAPLTTDRGPDGSMQQEIGAWRVAVGDVLTALARRSRAGRLSAIALTGQMQDLILLDECGRATHPVVLYSDTRATAELTELLDSNPLWPASISTAPPPGPDALPPKLLHLHRREPEAVEHAHTVLFSAAGWLASALCGAAVCDRLTASTTSAYNARTDDWFRLQTATGQSLVPDHLVLPDLVDPGVVGYVASDAARVFSLPAGLPIVMALGDAGAATDGMVGSEPGDVYLHLGTTGWVGFIDPTPAKRLPLPQEVGRATSHHQLAHPAGTLMIARMPEAGEALERARWNLWGFENPHSLQALTTAEVALTPSDAGAAVSVEEARRGAAYRRAVQELASEVRQLLESLDVTCHALPVTGGVVRSAQVRRILETELQVPVVLIPDAEAGLLSCARTGFDALGIPHTITPLAE